MDTALITALVSLITAVSSIVFTIVKIRKERDDRRLEFQYKVAEIETKFLHERVAQRYKTYPEVFKVLGTVRDVSDPAEEHYKSLLQNRKQLQETADNILKHLYGDAGLVMGMPTRNALLSVWLACHLFQTNEVTLQQLIGYFFIARRWLRADLQIIDVQEVTSELAIIKRKYNLEESDKKIALTEETWIEELTRTI